MAKPFGSPFMAEMFPKSDLIATMRCQPGALLPCKLDWPIHRICYWGGRPTDTRRPSAPIWRDLWGVGWQKQSSDPHMMPFPVEHPLEANLEAVTELAVPNAEEQRVFVDLANVRQPPHRLLIGEHPFALYERAWLLAGLQNLLESMTTRPALIEELVGRIGDFELSIARGYIRLGVEAAWISDDYGMTTAPMFSPAMWRRFIRPTLGKLVECYHQAGVIVILHSCGSLTSLVDDLIEVGIDVLDPLQPGCNRLDLIRARTAGRMCLCGGVEASTLLAGDVRKTSADTQRRIAELAAEGGYIAGPDDEWDFPPDTHDAMLAAVEQHRDAARRKRA